MTAFRRIWKSCPFNTAACAACILLFFATFAIQPLTIGMQFFWFFTRFVLLAAMAYHMVSICVSMGWAGRTMRILRLLMRIAAAVWLASFLIVLGFIIWMGQPDDGEDVPFIVVLGAGLNGTEPSLILKHRLDKAIEMSEANPDAKLILCGGLGAGDTITEAEAMRRYLVRNGIDEEKLILEDASRDTAENIRNAKAIMDSLDGGGSHKAYIVTCSFHMMRSKLLAEKYGIEPYAAPVKTRPQEYHYYIREYFSVLIYIIELTGITIDTSALNL